MVTSPLRTRSGEFSKKTKLGRTSPIMRCISNQSPLLLPLIPFPLPATEMSWQGNPPVMMSMCPHHSLPLNVRMSSQIGNGRNIPSLCLRRRMSLANWSISTAQTVCHPRIWLPRMPPPAPAKRASSLSFFRLASENTTIYSNPIAFRMSLCASIRAEVLTRRIKSSINIGT